MLNAEERTILNDYKKAFKSYYNNKDVVTLDRRIGRKLDDFLVRINDMISEVGQEIPPYKRSNIIILYFLSGSGVKKVADVAIDIRSGTLIVVPPYTINSSSYHSSVKGYYLTFSLNFFLKEYFPRHHLIKMDLFNPEFAFHAYTSPKEEQLLSAIFEIILDERAHRRKNKEELIALKILELIIQCERLLKFENSSKHKILPPLVNKYMQLINEDFKLYHNTSYYAKKLHIHPNQLNANTKKYLGQPAKATIDSMLMKEAEFLLFQTTRSIKELAYELGFQSASHFSRFFKRHKKISPASYRAQHLKM